MLRAFITDAAWIVDADVTLPVRPGRIDFDTVTVEHVGPNSKDRGRAGDGARTQAEP